MPQTILIAEDDRGVLKQLTRVVEEAGYRCCGAVDGVAALEQVRDERPALVLLDLLLPKRDGREVLATLQSRDDTSGIPVIAMSGIFRGRNTARELRDAGAQGFLEKPFSPDDLIAHLHALLGRPEPEPEPEAKPEPELELETEGAADSVEKAPEAPAIPDEDVLAGRTMAALLWQVMSEGFSGAIQFQLEKNHKVVVFDGGTPRQVRSNRAAECLGRRLFRAGRIDGEALQESLRRTREDGGRQGEILVEMGVIGQEEVEHELLAQAEDKLLELFAWDGGRAWRQPGVGNISYATELEGWTPRWVVLRGVSRMNEERARTELAGLADLNLSVSDGDLSAEEQVIPHIAEAVAVIRSGASTQEVIESYAGPLYGLWLTGLVHPLDPETGRVATNVPVSGPQTDPVEDDPGAAALREELAEMEQKDHFELLGVDENADDAAVRSGFMRLAKSYHPDRHSTRSDAVRQLASEIFALLSTASDTLSDPAARQEYVRKVRHGSSPDGDRKAVERIMSAEQSFNRGEEMFGKRAYKPALEHFRRALEGQEDEADYHAYFGLTHYLVHHQDSGAAALARQHIDRALALAPGSSTGYYFLGRLHKACAELEPAQKMFRKVLDISPDHVEASRELRLIEMRKTKGESGGGIFGFGKKRK